MARMYSRKKGKAGSKSLIKREKPIWIRYKPEEIELLIKKLAKEGKTASQIGLELRDSYGIPKVKLVLGKSITKVLKEHKLLPALPDDLVALMKKCIKINKHLETNKKDQTAKRGHTLTESKIRRLVKYYKRSGVLPSDWKYEPEKLRFYVS